MRYMLNFSSIVLGMLLVACGGSSGQDLFVNDSDAADAGHTDTKDVGDAGNMPEGSTVMDSASQDSAMSDSAVGTDSSDSAACVEKTCVPGGNNITCGNVTTCSGMSENCGTCSGAYTCGAPNLPRNPSLPPAHPAVPLTDPNQCGLGCVEITGIQAAAACTSAELPHYWLCNYTPEFDAYTSTADFNSRYYCLAHTDHSSSMSFCCVN